MREQRPAVSHPSLPHKHQPHTNRSLCTAVDHLVTSTSYRKVSAILQQDLHHIERLESWWTATELPLAEQRNWTSFLVCLSKHLLHGNQQPLEEDVLDRPPYASPHPELCAVPVRCSGDIPLQPLQASDRSTASCRKPHGPTQVSI